MTGQPSPHKGQPVLHTGADLDTATAAVIMLHGRGANAADILGLAESFDRPGLAYLAPEAAGHTWYPLSFLAPTVRNQPFLASALEVIADLVGFLITKDILPERTALVGFSQGACLSLEFAARHPDRYGAVGAFTGGLIGESIDPSDYHGSLEGTPVFIGSSDVDPHVPLPRVRESSAIMAKLGGEVTEKVYPGMAHTINEDEIEHVRALLDRMAG
ncbi:MAG: dienelactone hydrolase family protein [Bauldia sp.]|nr:dienelactone hydrolase family protein [Bauldia sp.]